ncbi:M56 family metallopeptidase [Marinagarivorans cellulosilyticus]|uniref:Protein TonB n=1 Tax=Marinagarivorans cellulosilyticus TaxID=2721545 RepID=A0AAN2BK17_9GAMM|nr:M56 family metallopeptidase [Marinagarivorans cellulosilyticus]BCD97515.1 hypothetical protein MARGE09_P1716 [Marinagarivorans cellulosilyticus]
MFNLFVVIALLLKIILVFSCVRWWLYRSRDTHSGRLARLVCIAFLGVILLPLGSAILPAVALEVIPVNFWALFNINVYLTLPVILKVVIGIYLAGVFSVLIYRFWHLLEALNYASQLESAPEDVDEVFVSIKKQNNLLERVALKVGQSKVGGSNVVSQGPFTLGVLRPIIVLPEDYSQWSRSTLMRVLTHELAHVVRKDWFWQNVLQCLIAFVWFLPSAWRLGKQFSWLSELNADDAVLAGGSGRSDYADDLLNIAARYPRAPRSAAALIDGSYCYERIAAILDGSRLRSHTPFKQTPFWVWLVAVLAWLSLSTITLEAAAVSLWHEGDTGGKTLTFYSFPEPNKDGANSALAVPVKLTPHTQPRSYKESVVIIEREPYLTKEALLSEAKTAMNHLAAVDADNLPVVPNVSVQGYVALRAVIPEYPKRAQRKNIEGQVIVQFDVLPSGKADAIRIAMASPKHIFDDAVLEAMAKSIFKPATDNGRPIKTQHATQTFTFRLSEGAKTKNFNPTFGTPIQTAEQSTHAAP